MSKGITNSQLKNIFIISISFLTFAFFILNTNHGKSLTYKIKTNLLPRNLQSAQSQQKTTKICEKISSELKDYFQTGDKTTLGLEEDNTEDYDAYYIEALINIVKHYYAKKQEKQESNLRILDDDDDGSSGYMKYIMKYAYHILPLLICLGIGILSLIGWIVCCCCTCQKCKCCVCKVPKCKTPSTVLALISYVIVALISFYALVEQKKVFTGLADIECTVLRFTDNVLEGETQKFPPYWAGIDKISEILRDFRTKTEELRTSNVLTQLNSIKATSDNNKDTFENQLASGSDTIYTDINYRQTFSGKNYQLDIAKQFGKYTKGTGTTQDSTTAENSVSQLWLDEYKKITKWANGNMTEVDTSFNAIFAGNSLTDFETSMNKMIEIKSEFNSLKTLISDKIVERADDIDKYGNLVYTLFFTLLMIFCAAIIVFMLLLCCCSGELCTNLSCCQCFCKFFLHFFWNLMAFIMFILFMGGSLFTISGTVGDDLVNVVSYLTSEDNLGPDKDTIILGNVKQYLNRCFNYDGNILSQLNLVDEDMNYFEKLKKAKLELEELKNQFNDKLYKFVYSEYKEELEQRINYNTADLKLVSISGDNTPSIEFVNLLNKINAFADTNGKNENWDITSSTTNACDPSNKDEVTHDSKIIYHPKNCYPTVKTWSSGVSDEKSKLDGFKSIIDFAKSNDPKSIKTILEDLGNKYNSFLESEITTLGKYIEKISTITDLSMDYTSEDDDLFSFMNCKFIKDNVDVILYYLKHSFQNDIYEVGVYLLIASFAMPFGISFTILLIVISNEEIEANKEKESKEKEKQRRKSLGTVPPPQIEEVKLEKNEGDNTEQRPFNNNNIINNNNPN